jgi:hypothetical protein
MIERIALDATLDQVAGLRDRLAAAADLVRLAADADLLSTRDVKALGRLARRLERYSKSRKLRGAFVERAEGNAPQERRTDRRTWTSRVARLRNERRIEPTLPFDFPPIEFDRPLPRSDIR